MEFLKKSLYKNGRIYSKDILNEDTREVVKFYKESPFPNYKANEDKSSIVEKGDKNFLTKSFKKFVGYKKKILEVGCGTGQFSNYFAIGTNNQVIGLDPTIFSLKLATTFADTNNINNVEFINADIFDDVLTDNFFDFLWCNGVLHHTKNPSGAFNIMIKSLKKDGYVLVGLYNKLGRIRTIVRKYFYKIFGIKILYLLDPTLKKLKVSESEKQAWIRDQYHHPIESLHTLDQVLNWFEENNIDFVNSIPSCDFYSDNELFQKQSKGTFYSRIFNQFSMIFNSLGSDGGLFVVIGKKR